MTKIVGATSSSVVIDSGEIEYDGGGGGGGDAMRRASKSKE